MGARFSANARGPSMKSSLPRIASTESYRCLIDSSSEGVSRLRYTTSLEARIDSGAQAQIICAQRFAWLRISASGTTAVTKPSS